MSTDVRTGPSAGDSSEGLAAHAHWALRIALASVFLFHGLSKFGGLQAGAEMMGLPVFVWTLVALAEVAGGVLVLAGGAMAGRRGDIATRLGGLAVIPVLLGAIFMVHWGRWHFAPSESHPMGGMEFQVVLLLIAVYFALRGNR